MSQIHSWALNFVFNGTWDNFSNQKIFKESFARNVIVSRSVFQIWFLGNWKLGQSLSTAWANSYKFHYKMKWNPTISTKFSCTWRNSKPTCASLWHNLWSKPLALFLHSTITTKVKNATKLFRNSSTHSIQFILVLQKEVKFNCRPYQLKQKYLHNFLV